MKIKRLIKHRCWDEFRTRRVISKQVLDNLEAYVHSSEVRHTGEIRLCIEGGLPLSYLWRDAVPRERAVAMFGKLRVWDTEDNNGVLIYLLMADHAIEIVVDRGLSRHVPSVQWHHISEELSASLKAGEYESGLKKAIDTITAALIEHFPAQEGQINPDELPNRPYLR